MSTEFLKLVFENREYGITILVLAGLFFLLKPLVNKYIEWEEARRKKAEKRSDDESQFLRELVHQSRVEGEARAVDVQKLVEKVSESIDKQTSVMQDMNTSVNDVKKNLDTHERMSRERMLAIKN